MFTLYGNKNILTNVNASLPERAASAGLLWRYGSDYQSLVADGDYYSINIIAPADGLSIYSFAAIDKSGDELLVTLIEGGTYVGGTLLSPWSTDRASLIQSPFIVKGGLSTAGVTITGGVAAPNRLIGGTSGGNSKPGGSTEGSGYARLKPSESYTLKIIAKGAVTFATIFNIAHIPW